MNLANRKRLSVTEGDWVLVPIDGGDYCVGVVARHDGEHGALGYFFGPKVKAKPSNVRVETFQPKDAVLIAQFSDLGIARGDWPIIAHTELDHAVWPVPEFGRTDLLRDGLGFRTKYSDQVSELGEELCTVDEVRHLPYDCVHGAESLAVGLRQVFDGTYDPYRMPPH